jgi:hypothetical protein
MKTQTSGLYSAMYLSLALLLMAGAATALAEAGPEPRTSNSSQWQGIDRDGITEGVVSLDELDPLLITGKRDKSTRASGQQAPSAAGFQSGAMTPNVEFWIYDASVELYSDWDQDGHYYGIDLTFDADTVYTAADVYAVVYLSYDFGPWNEYSSTDDFTIFGASGTDEYAIDTELVSGYITGDYDILIELFDTYDGSFVASFGPEDSSELSYLPLEDAGRDTPPPATTVIVNEGGGGSAGLLGLLALLTVTGLRSARALPA